LLEERVALLESKVDQLLHGSHRRRDWRRTLGMFAGEELMKEIDAEARQIRLADREAAIAALDAEKAR